MGDRGIIEGGGSDRKLDVKRNIYNDVDNRINTIVEAIHKT